MPTETLTDPLELSPHDAHALANSGAAVVVDVREPWEWATGHAAGATHVPLDSIAERHSELPNGKALLLICAGGNRSLRAARYLGSLGYDARSIAGGTAAWSLDQLPLEHGSDDPC